MIKLIIEIRIKVKIKTNIKNVRNLNKKIMK